MVQFTAWKVAFLSFIKTGGVEIKNEGERKEKLFICV
jgi:hypothetical protein